MKNRWPGMRYSTKPLIELILCSLNYIFLCNICSNKFLEGLVDGVSLSDLRYARWAPANVAGKEVILTR